MAESNSCRHLYNCNSDLISLFGVNTVSFIHRESFRSRLEHSMASKLVLDPMHSENTHKADLAQSMNLISLNKKPGLDVM